MLNTEAATTTLRLERDRYALLAFCWGDLLLTLDPRLRIETVSGASEALTGLSEYAWTGRKFTDLIAEKDRGRIAAVLETLTPTRRALAGTIRLAGREGATGTRVSVAAHRLDTGRDAIFVSMRMLAEDAPDEPEEIEEVPRLAERLAAASAQGAEMTLFAIPEIPRDTGGPLGETLDDLLRAHSLGGDTAMRLDSRHYSVLHEAGRSFGPVIHQIEAMIHAADPTAPPPRIESMTLPMQAEGMSESDLARGLVYAMHRFGEGSELSLHEAGQRLRERLSDAMGSVTRLRRAIDDGVFGIAFQPIVDLYSGAIDHFEALARFDQAGTGSPFETIRLAEETGLIEDFDLAMARKAVSWFRTLPLNNENICLAVNISGRSINSAAYAEGLHRLLEENHWLRRRLSFEITESAQIADLDAANGFIQGLRRRGFSVALDDFGAGAASFRYLSALEVDAVKFDGAAIRHAQRAQKGRAFLSALTELCRRMGISTVAEMIETPEALAFVRDCGCNFVQGYLFGQPAAEIGRFAQLPNRGLLVPLQRPRTVAHH
ncbi:EAL domain-containing protein [Acidiphilium sp. JA12-A1]|uniref:EAL domain-containing protein n=1 Tax=Acidiphilium sp. JA12-A1 TaxID=1464546 RepID=UPI0004620538|nr:EAL domain-containing protein [Acidiphilium sp. JA12-A1]KDM66154.1 diguanylate phosphodiesterase [Acidiphilium sp. JA12-A1]